MATKEKALEKLDELLQCSVCLDTFSDPRILPCFHVYCQRCLRGLVVRGGGGNHSISCPACRRVTPVPAKGVVGFQAAYRINDLEGIHKVLDTPGKASSCSVHSGRELELYCETCEELICLRCAYRGGKHHDHAHQDVDEAIKMYKESIRPLLESCPEMISQLLNLCNVILVVYQETVVSQIKADLETELTEINALPKVDGNILSKKEVLKLINQMLVKLMGTTVLIKSSFAKLESPDPLLCHITGEVEAVVVGEKAVLTLHVVTVLRQPYKESVAQSLEVKVTGDTAVACEVERREPSQYGINYWPAVEGKLKLHIKIDNQHIRGSPFLVTARPPAERVDFVPILPGGRRPFGVATRGRWEVVVSDEDKHCVSIYNLATGNHRSFGSYGSREGRFSSPHGIAVDNMGNILVADCFNHRIQMFTAEGKFITAVGRVGRRSRTFYYPSAVAFNKTNSKVYVVDKNSLVQTLNCVTKYSFSWKRWCRHSLSFCGVFGGRGCGVGQFEAPSSIACDGAGKVYVADTGNRRIQVFTAEMEFLHMFGVLGDGMGTPSDVQMRSLQSFGRLGRGDMNENYHIGVAVDDGGRVCVCESGHISVFTPQGKFVKSVGRMRGRFATPRGLAVSRDGVLYVCDGSDVLGSKKPGRNFRQAVGMLFAAFFLAAILIMLYIFSY